MNSDPYFHQLMWGLFYPAVLGSIFYSLIDYVSKERKRLDHTKLFLTFLVVVHYSLDYLAVKRATTYSWLSFGLDVLVVIALFSAFYFVRLAHPREEPSYRWLSLSMGTAYVLYVIWTLHNISQITPPAIALSFDVVFAVIYLGVAWIRPRKIMVVSVLLLNCIFYCFIVNKTQVGTRPVAPQEGSAQIETPNKK